MIRGLSKIFKLFRITGDASPTEGKNELPSSRKSVAENDASKTNQNINMLRRSDFADECSSLDSFESAKSSERIDEQPSHGDATKRSTPLGLQPRPSIEMIRKKLGLNVNHQIVESPGESKSDQLHCAYTTSNSGQLERDASFSISTPNITYGTTLTAVGAFVAEADKEREKGETSKALALNAMNRTYLGKMLATSENSTLSISSIYSPLRSTCVPPPLAYNRSVANSPASSSSFSSEDDFSSQHHGKLQSWILGSYQLDPASLPPYQMIETPEKRRSRRSKRGGNKKNWSAYTQRDDLSETTGRGLEKYTSTMIISSPSSSTNNSYNGVEDSSSSDDEQDIPQIMLLTPGRVSSSSEQIVATPSQLQHAHSSLIMTSPSSYSAYPTRTFCNAATAARFLEASFEQALIQKSTTAVAHPMRQDHFSSNTEHHLVRVSKSSKWQLPYDFDIIDDNVNDASDVNIDPSSHIRDTIDLQEIEYDKVKKNENSLPSISHFLIDADKETSIICYTGKDMKTDSGISTDKIPQSLVDEAGHEERLLLRKRQNQWKSKVHLLQRMVWCLQDNLELVLDIERQGDFFYQHCPSYVQSSTSDGPAFVKTMSNEEGIIPGYTEGTQSVLTHRLSNICTGDDDADMRDALEFIKSLIQRKTIDRKKLTIVKKIGIIERNLLEFSDSSQLSPGFTAPTNSNFDPNLSLASTISSKASFVLKSNNSYPDKPRRTILIASSILQKVTYALQNLIKGEYKNVLKRTKTSFRHYYLQLMNLPHKHIQEVLDLFSIFEDGATSLAEGQHSSMHQAKDSNNLITFPHPLGRNNRACGTEQSSAVSAMKEYESVIENFLLQQSQNSSENGSTNQIERVTYNNENECLAVKLGNDNLVSPITASFPEQSEFAANQKPFVKQKNRLKKKKFGDLKNSVNRTVLGSL